MANNTIKEVKLALANLGLYTGLIDENFDDCLKRAVTTFQKINPSLKVDGIINEKFTELLFSSPIPDMIEPSEPMNFQLKPSDIHWPAQNQAALEHFYGEIGKNQVLLSTPYPLRLAWAPNTVIHKISCHAKIAKSLQYIFEQTLEHYGLEKIRELGLDLFGGCLSVRLIRGGNKYSTHSWGIAFDIDPLSNQYPWNKSKAKLARPEYQKFWEIVESTGAVSLGRQHDYDWMHFQFAQFS